MQRELLERQILLREALRPRDLRQILLRELLGAQLEPLDRQELETKRLLEATQHQRIAVVVVRPLTQLEVLRIPLMARRVDPQ